MAYIKFKQENISASNYHNRYNLDKLETYFSLITNIIIIFIIIH